MADKNIGAYSAGVVLPATHLVAVQAAPNALANIDPVLIPIDDVGGVGPSAYDVAVSQGFSGDEDAWLLTLKGDPGDPGIQGVAGPTGPAGAGLTPDEYGNLTEAKITAIEGAGVPWIFVVNPDGDDRANQGIPSTLSGDMERHVIRWDPVGAVWKDFGFFTGIEGPPGPQGNQGNQGIQGIPGLGAYADWLAAGNSGSIYEFLDSLVGPPGPPISVQIAVTIPLPYGNNPAVANIGSLTAPVLQFSLPLGTQGPVGPQGDPGPTVVPDQYGVFNESVVTAIQTADVDWNFLIIAAGDTRVNKTLPAALNGDMSGHLVRYEGATNTWFDLGPIVGVAGPAGPGGTAGGPGADGDPGLSAYQVALLNGFVGTEAQWLTSLKGDPGNPGTNGVDGVAIPRFDIFIAHPDGVAEGGYPVTLYADQAFTITRITRQAATTTSCTLFVNGVPVDTANYTSAGSSDVVDIDIQVSDEILFQINAGGTTYIGCTMTGVGA